MSGLTKRMLAQSLIKLLYREPLSSITVQQITDDCGVNRQTFYYHFQDIYALLEWIFEEDARQLLGGNVTYASWKEKFLGNTGCRPRTSIIPSAGPNWYGICGPW